jgi:hypothetical protein
MKRSRAFEVPGLADSLPGGGWLIQSFIFPICEDIWSPSIAHSMLDAHQVSSRVAGQEDATRQVEAGKVFW